MKKKNDIIRLFLDAKPIWHWLFLGAFFSIVAVVCAVVTPELLGSIIQVLYDAWEIGDFHLVRTYIGGKLLILLGVFLIGGIMSYCNMLLTNKTVSRYYTCGLRVRISEKISTLPVSYVDQTPVGDILSRVNDDVSEMGGYIHQIFDILVKGIFQILLIAGALFAENWMLAIFVVLLTPISVFLSVKIASATECYFENMFAQSGKVTALVEETFSNYSMVKAYGLEDYCYERQAEENEKLRKISSTANFAGSAVQPIIRFANSLSYILINLLGGWLMVSQGVSVGTVVCILLYARQFAAPLEELAYGLGRMNQVKAAAGRVFEILDMPQEDNPTQEKTAQTCGKVEFQEVFFSYEKNKALIENLNLQVQPGQKVAIVGPTGAGKTTIVNLLMRFYDPVSGKILLDGEDIGTLSREEVRNCFAMVLQDTWLFRGSIYENVAYGKKDATLEQVVQVCKRTYCHSFIEALPQGYDTVISDDSATLSGGQKQLLTIARVLLADKPVLILDEATSNVDTRTEILIQKAMDKLMKGRTCFVIAHRLSTIVNSDVILVLHNGQIIEQGTHQQLLAQNGFYEKLYKSQYAL